MKHLLSVGKVVPMLFNGKLISIKVRINIKGYKGKTIIFKDSYLMLPLSLRQLCNSFKVDSVKGYFPFKLTDISYKGTFPNYELFTSLSLPEYLDIKNLHSNKIWSFKKEAIKYCKLDCLSLHQILTKFSELIFKEFKVDPIRSLTLPALAMRIYKTHFMPADTIYQILDQPQELIRNSYTGGSVDVYIPSFTASKAEHETTKLYYYDVNSLYPSVMLNNPNFNLYYSDTDSAVVDSELPKSFIGDKLGKLKLEYTIDKAVFLAPKVYGLIDVDGIELIKAKGLTKDSIRNIKVSDLEQLLVKDASKVFTQSKGYKELFEGHISISDILYTLSATSSKRRHSLE